MSESSEQPQQPGPLPGAPPYPYRSPQPGAYSPPQYGMLTPSGPMPPPPRRRGRRALWIALVTVGVVLVVGGGFVSVVGRLSQNSGKQAPEIPSVQAAPSEPPPARSGLYTKVPPACALLSDPTIRSLYPGAVGKETNMDRHDSDAMYVDRGCEWESPPVGGGYIRFLTVDLRATIGYKGLETMVFDYQTKAANLEKVRRTSTPSRADVSSPTSATTPKSSTVSTTLVAVTRA